MQQNTFAANGVHCCSVRKQRLRANKRKFYLFSAHHNIVYFSTNTTATPSLSLNSRRLQVQTPHQCVSHAQRSGEREQVLLHHLGTRERTQRALQFLVLSQTTNSNYRPTFAPSGPALSPTTFRLFSILGKAGVFDKRPRCGGSGGRGRRCHRGVVAANGCPGIVACA